MGDDRWAGSLRRYVPSHIVNLDVGAFLRAGECTRCGSTHGAGDFGRHRRCLECGLRAEMHELEIPLIKERPLGMLVRSRPGGHTQYVPYHTPEELRLWVSETRELRVGQEVRLAYYTEHVGQGRWGRVVIRGRDPVPTACAH